MATAYVAGGAGTYAEIGFATGDFVGCDVSNVVMTVRGTTDVAAIYDTAGLYTTEVTCSGITAGDDLWLVYGCRSTGTKFELRGVLADVIRSGVFRLNALTQPSTMADDTTVNTAGATIVPAWARAVI